MLTQHTSGGACLERHDAKTDPMLGFDRPPLPQEARPVVCCVPDTVVARWVWCPRNADTPVIYVVAGGMGRECCLSCASEIV